MKLLLHRHTQTEKAGGFGIAFLPQKKILVVSVLHAYSAAIVGFHMDHLAGWA